LGYVGVEGIEIVPLKRLPGGDLTPLKAEFNIALGKSGPPSNTPSCTSRHGGCSAKKVTGFSSSQLMNKPPGDNHMIMEGWPRSGHPSIADGTAPDHLIARRHCTTELQSAAPAPP
jgi:hypothetical protein